MKMMNRQRYQIKAKATRAELLIYGDIGDSWYEEESNDAKSVVKAIDANSGPIDVRINSFGGSVADGLAIFNALRRYSGEIVTHIDGVAYSIASLIAMGGDEIRMASNSMLMIHAPWGITIGNAPEMREMADILDKHAEAMTASYLRDEGPDAETVRGWLHDGADHYFTAVEAVDLGLVDTVTDSQPVFEIAAALRAGGGRYRLPAAYRRNQSEETAVMADNPTPAGGAPISPETDQLVASHSRTVKAATAKGIKSEADRRKAISSVFADFYDADPLNPVTALHDQCMEDTACQEIDARRRLMNMLAQRSEDPIVVPEQYAIERTTPAPPQASRHLGGAPQISRDQQDKRADGISVALQIKAGLERDRDVINRERSNEFLGMSLPNLMAHELRAAGRPVNGGPRDVANAYINAQPIMAAGPSHGTGHLTGILADVANKSAMMGWDQAEETWRIWTEEGRLNDYRAAQRANLALLDELDAMEEHQEFEYGDMADFKQSITGLHRGKKYSLTIQSIVNDDLGELTRAMNAWGNAASRTVGTSVFALLTATGSGGFGQSMDEDSKVLFHADHANYIASGSGGAPAEDTLNAGYVAMSIQTDPNSVTVGIRPRYIIHGATLASTVFRQVVSEKLITGEDATAPDQNWVRSLGLMPVQEHRMDGLFSGLAWILAAGRRTVEVSGVAGPLEPRVEQMSVGNIAGIDYKIEMPFGAAVLDYRGMYFNYGA